MAITLSEAERAELVRRTGSVPGLHAGEDVLDAGADLAANEDQIHDLIPASPTCLVLITSRRSLAGLDGASPHPLDTFSDLDALDLLTRIAGHDRVGAEPEAAMRIVRR